MGLLWRGTDNFTLRSVSLSFLLSRKIDPSVPRETPSRHMKTWAQGVLEMVPLGEFQDPAPGSPLYLLANLGGIRTKWRGNSPFVGSSRAKCRNSTGVISEVGSIAPISSQGKLCGGHKEDSTEKRKRLPLIVQRMPRPRQGSVWPI